VNHSLRFGKIRDIDFVIIANALYDSFNDERFEPLISGKTSTVTTRQKCRLYRYRNLT